LPGPSSTAISPDVLRQLKAQYRLRVVPTATAGATEWTTWAPGVLTNRVRMHVYYQDYASGGLLHDFAWGDEGASAPRALAGD
jgi:hypothetical protein